MTPSSTASPAGEWIAFFSDRSGPLELWMVRPDGSELTQLTDASGIGVPVWSPDGNRMAGSGTTVDGRDVFVFDPRRPWAPQDPETLPRPAGPLAAFAANSWSADGERLAGQPSFSDAGIMVYTFRTGAYERLTDVGEWPVWLPDGRHLLFVTGGKEFLVIDTGSREVRSVFAVTRDVIGPPRLSPDGREVYFTRRVNEADVWLLTLR